MKTLSATRSNNSILAWGILIASFAIVGFLWLTDNVIANNLLYKVDWNIPIPSLESKYLYTCLHLFIMMPILLLSFDTRVSYYKKWKALFPALFIVGAFFIAWDVFFTHIDVWDFNSDYYIGYKIFHLPPEEWFFFISAPFACVFIYECLNHYFPKDRLASLDRPITISSIILFFIIGISFWSHIYTSTTFLLSGAALLWHFLFVKNNYRTLFYRAYLVSLIPFLMVNGVLTGGYTQKPIVVYNPEEYLGLRITSVPVDDAVYLFLLMLLITGFYEKFKKKRNIT